MPLCDIAAINVAIDLPSRRYRINKEAAICAITHILAITSCDSPLTGRLANKVPADTITVNGQAACPSKSKARYAIDCLEN